MDSNRDMSKTVTIPGELHSVATGNVVAASEEIFDYKTNSRQSDLNMDSLSYNVSKHHPEKDFYTFDEAVRLVPEEFRVGGLKLTFISDSSNMETYFYNGLNSEDFLNEDNWSSSVGKYIDNPEYLQVTLDKEDKVLEGIQSDGTKFIGGDINIGGSVSISGDAKILGNMEVSGVSYKVVENSEYLAAWIDVEDKIIFGLKTDGKTYVGDADFLSDIKNIKSFLANVLSDIDWDALLSITIVDNNEFIDVETDSEGRILSSRDNDGIKKEYTGFETPKVSIDGHSIENIEDPEGRSEITIDAKGMVLSYRKKDGTLVENAGIETNHLELTEQGMTDFQQALKDAGFTPGGGGDWSDMEVIELPEPKHYALLNLIVDSLPLNDGEVSEGFAVYYDGLGNYFRLECSLEPQGQTSRIFAKTGGKGNYTLDLPKDVKFGSWVPQDSFHLKGCAKDVVRGILPTSYKWAYMFMEYLNAKPNRVLLKDDSETTITHASGDRMTDWGDGARCLPDGFPVEVYINGEYWGLYSWQLKKHRKNYSMNKKDYTSFFLDTKPIMSDTLDDGFWTGDIWWNKIDIKNPKDLICMDGSEFDGDHPKELIDDTSEYYDSTNKKHVGSATTKAIIKSFPAKYLEVKSLIDADNIVLAKEKFNEYFDYNACMLVYIFNCTTHNSDSIKKNTLWATYKNGKIAPMLWDLDAMYGGVWIGISAGSPSANLWRGSYATAAWPLALFWNLYESEIKAVYAELRRNDIISINTWKSIVFGWVNRIGAEAYKRDIDKWPETPSYRKNLTNTDYWRENSMVDSLGNYSVWDAQSSYSIGNKVVIKAYAKFSYYMVYTAVQPSSAQNPQCPVTGFYNEFPVVGGFYDSPKRWEKWMVKQIELCDNFMGYTE